MEFARNNWVCPYCKKENPYSDILCSGCGSLRPENVSLLEKPQNIEDLEELISNTTEDEILVETTSDDVLKLEDNDELIPIDDEDLCYYSSSSSKYEDFFEVFPALVIGFIFVMCFLLLIVELSFPDNHTNKAFENEETITGFSWERCVVVEELVTVEEKGTVLPENAKLLYEMEESSSQEKEVSFYIVGENEEKYPIYKDLEFETFYYYEIEKWNIVEYEKTAGDDRSPYWAEPEIEDGQKSSEYYELYFVHIVDKNGKEFTYSCDEEMWNSCEIGDKLQYNTDSFGYLSGDVVLKKKE